MRLLLCAGSVDFGLYSGIRRTVTAIFKHRHDNCLRRIRILGIPLIVLDCSLFSLAASNNVLAAMYNCGNVEILHVTKEGL